MRIEDKGPIIAYHWRGAADEQDARAAVDTIAAHAQESGFDVHWGRKVMEVRPPVRIDKGLGVRTLLGEAPTHRRSTSATTPPISMPSMPCDELVKEGMVERAVCVGVSSEDGPPAIEDEADMVVAGTEGVRGLLSALIAE